MRIFLLLGLVLLSALVDAGGLVVGNNDVIIGITDEGDMNTPYVGGFLSLPAGDPISIGQIGLRNGDGQYASTEPGCQCEGWGVGVPAHGISLSANQDIGGDVNIVADPIDGVNGGSYAISTVKDTSDNIQVVQDYHTTTATTYAMENTVTITNIGGLSWPSVRYRRVMDWDIYPTPFSEYVTIYGTAATDLIRSHDNGFGSADPLVNSSPLNAATLNVDFVDDGPNDHGASFTFEFTPDSGSIEPGDSISFNVYYGVAPGEDAALSALGSVGAEVYSLGQNSATSPGPGGGYPFTFFFGFNGVGGEAVCSDFEYVDDGTPRTRDEAQAFCQATFGSDLASFTGVPDLTCICDLIEEAGGSAAWVQMTGDHSVGFSFPDGTPCPNDNPYCVNDELWCNGNPLGCKIGSTCVHVTAFDDAECPCSLHNNVDCENTLTAVVCNRAVTTRR